MKKPVTEVHDLLEKWDYDKNIILPDQVTTGSGKKVWWICPRGHSYEDSVNHQASGRNCPVCAGRKVLKGFNDVFSVHPELIPEWDYEKNIICPDAVTSGSNTSVWWKCPKDHSYMMQILARVRGRNCPVCAGKIVVEGTNDLSTVHPELISEWDYEKNILLPTQVTAGSNKKIWWICKQGHLWETSVKIRSKGSGCPVCARKRTSPNRIQLQQVIIEYPQLEQEYNYEMNKNIKDITTQTNFGGNARRNIFGRQQYQTVEEAVVVLTATTNLQHQKETWRFVFLIVWNFGTMIKILFHHMIFCQILMHMHTGNAKWGIHGECQLILRQTHGK